jgi:hypothetical protein
MDSLPADGLDNGNTLHLDRSKALLYVMMKGSVIYGGSFLAGVFGYIAPTLQSVAMITIYNRHISFLVLSLDPFNGFIEAVYGLSPVISGILR